MELHVIQNHVELEMSVSSDVCNNITTHLVRPFKFKLSCELLFSFMNVSPLSSVELHSRLFV